VNIDSPFIDFMGNITYAWSVKRTTNIGTNTAAVPAAGTGREYIVKYTKPNVSFTATNKETYTVTCKATVSFGVLGLGAVDCLVTGTQVTPMTYTLAPIPKPVPAPVTNMVQITAAIKNKNVLKLDTIPVTLIEFLKQMKTGGTQMRDVIKNDITTYDTENPALAVMPPGLTQAQQDKLLAKILKDQPVGKLIDKYMIYSDGWKGATALADQDITVRILEYSGSKYDINGDLLSNPNIYDPTQLRKEYINVFNSIWASFQKTRPGGDNKKLLRHLIFDLFRAVVLQYTGSAPTVEERVDMFAPWYKVCIGDIPIYDTATPNNGLITQKLHWTKAAGTKDLTFASPADPTARMEKLIKKDKDAIANIFNMVSFNEVLKTYALDPADSPDYPGE